MTKLIDKYLNITSNKESTFYDVNYELVGDINEGYKHSHVLVLNISKIFDISFGDALGYIINWRYQNNINNFNLCDFMLGLEKYKEASKPLKSGYFFGLGGQDGSNNFGLYISGGDARFGGQYLWGIDPVND